MTLAILGIVGCIIYRVWQYFLEALDIYGNEIRTFLDIGMLIIPIGLLFNGITWLVRKIPPLDWVEEYFSESAGGEFAAAALIGGAQQTFMALLVIPAVVFAMKDIRQGIKPGVWRSYRGSLKYLPTNLVALVIFVVLALASTFSILLIPVAIYVAVRWQFYPQAAVLDEQKPGWRALGASWDVTRGKCLKTLASTIGFLFLAAVPGPLIGVIILIIGGSRVQFANLASSFLYALLIPLAYIGLTMVYHRLKGDAIIEPSMLTREQAEPGAPLPVVTPPTPASGGLPTG